MSICIVTEAMKAYSELSCLLPRHMDGGHETPLDFSTAFEDYKGFCIWVETYMHKHHGKQWWTLKPKKEILSMLSALPLDAISYLEVSELVANLCSAGYE